MATEGHTGGGEFSIAKAAGEVVKVISSIGKLFNDAAATLTAGGVEAVQTVTVSSTGPSGPSRRTLTMSGKN